MTTVLADRAQEQESALPVPQALSRMLESAWAKGLLPEPDLDPNALIAKAVRAERGELDEGRWREGLELLCGELQADAALNPLGRTIAHGLLARILRQRIRARRLWSRHAGILDRTVKAPVIILGQMRSGTTRLQRMLASDPRFAFTRLHETLDPVPRSRAAAIGAAAVVRSLLNRCNPQLRAIHPTSPFAAEEEFGLHAFSVHGAMLEAQWRVPAFARWCEQRPLAEVYRDFRRLVQTLGWMRREPEARIQLLKTPQFMEDLDEVLASFPDARLLLLTRDKDAVVASSASLVWNQQRVQSDAADPLWAGREWARKTEFRQQRADAALAAHPDVPVLRIDYAAMNRDWRSEMERIYRFLDLPLAEPVLGRMGRIAGSAKHKGHSYSRQRFGLA